MKFQDGCEKDPTLNQLITVTVEKSPTEKEPEVSTIGVIPDKPVDSKKVFYHGVYTMQDFTKDYEVDKKEEQADMEPGTDDEYMEDVRLDDKI